ncbi:MAG: ribonuclease HII [bacterium]|nr:ribonuclease HII [bacterium]
MAGIDEAGRGPLAGPVSVGITVFSPDLFAPDFYDPEHADREPFRGLDDSKKVKPALRDELFDAVRKHARFAAAIHISSKLVDGMRIGGALEFAMLRAIARAEQAGQRPRVVLIDGNYKLPQVRERYPDIHIECVVKGDSRIFSIAAASILAKVSRDRRMSRYEKLFPGYELEKHKGYGTVVHRARIRELGPCPIHRRSYTW